jgi:hypothetical protein
LYHDKVDLFQQVPHPEAALMRLQAASQLRSEPLPWLWPGRLALGQLAMLDGDPGLGKSYLALDLCARLSTGRPLPDGQDLGGAGSAIVLNVEDSGPDILLPRLRALSADLDRIFLLGDNELEGPLRLPGQTGLLDDALNRTKARLVVLDPLVSFLDASVCDNSNQSVRRALLPLAQLARQHQCVMLLIRHLNKKAGGRSLYRGTGSIGLLGACRSGWLVAPDPEDANRRVLAQVKNNLAPAQPSLAFTLQAGERGGTELRWLGHSALTADQLVAGGRRPAQEIPRDRARDFLEDFLRDGPQTSRALWEAAQRRRLSERTLYRARGELQIRVERVQLGTTRLDYWLLPGQRLPSSVPPEIAPPEVEDWLASLREQFPPRTPLDEL